MPKKKKVLSCDVVRAIKDKGVVWRGKPAANTQLGQDDEEERRQKEGQKWSPYSNTRQRSEQHKNDRKK